MPRAGPAVTPARGHVASRNARATERHTGCVRLHADARILVIDDEVSIQRLLQTILDRAGYTMVRCVGDPRQAVQVADELAPDIVLLDVTMPWLDGFEVLARLRGLPVTR